MPPLIDPDRLTAFLNALQNWRISGFIEFDLSPTARKYVREQLKLGSFENLLQLMVEFVTSGGEIDEVVETRPEWSSKWEFYHDLRFRINDRIVYVETRLKYRLPVIPDDSTILVVNVHDA